MKISSTRNHARTLARSVSACLLAVATGCDQPASDSPSAESTHEASAAPQAQVTDGTAPVSQWTMIGYDHGSTYNNTAETKLTKANAANLEVAWTAEMGDNVYGAPLQVGEAIYASTAAGGITAFNASDGKVLWKSNKSAGGTASISYDATTGLLYSHTNPGTIMAVDAKDGTTKWNKPSSPEGTDGSSSPVVAGDYVFIGGSQGALELSGGGRYRGYMAALNKVSGEIAWTSYTVPTNAKGASIWSSPAIDLAGGRVYGTTGNNYGAPATDTSDSILAFDLKTGNIIWKNQRTKGDTWGPISAGPDADFGANPVLYETMVNGVKTQLVSSGQKNGNVHAVRRDNGELVWTRNVGTGVGLSNATGTMGVFVNGTWTGKYMLYACNNNGTTAKLVALDGATGAIAWQRNLTGPVWGRMSNANGVGFVGVGNSLEVIDVDTGAVLKKFPSKRGTVAGTITIANGRVAYGEGMSWSTARPGSTLTVLQVK